MVKPVPFVTVHFSLHMLLTLSRYFPEAFRPSLFHIFRSKPFPLGPFPVILMISITDPPMGLRVGCRDEQIHHQIRRRPPFFRTHPFFTKPKTSLTQCTVFFMQLLFPSILNSSKFTFFNTIQQTVFLPYILRMACVFSSIVIFLFIFWWHF